MKPDALFSNLSRTVSLRIQVITLIILMLGALTLFTAELLTSQKYADGDEAVVGIMAKHILTKGERPIFYYGQPFGGGGAIEAYLATVPFTVWGVSSITLKSGALLLWLATIILSYLFCLRYYNYITALSSSIILITATPLIEWHLKMRGGYAAIPLFFVLILICFNYLVDNRSKSVWLYLLLGLLCGAAYYNLELILPLLLALFLFSIYWRQIFWKWKPVLLTAAGFMIGAGPLLIFNLANDFANFKYVFGEGSGQVGSDFFSRFLSLFTTYLPRFFVGRNVDTFIDNPPISAFLEYIIYVLLCSYLLIKTWPHVLRMARTLLSAAGEKFDPARPDIDVFLLLYLILYLIINSISSNSAASPRYLLPLFPALAFVAGRSVSHLIQEKNQILKLAGAILLSWLVLSGILNHVGYFGPSSVADDVIIEGKGRVTLLTSGETAPAIIDYLKEQSVSRVWSTYFIQWRLIFESDEEIIASSIPFSPGAQRYPLYDAQVRDSDEPKAIVLHQEDSQLLSLLERPHINGCAQKAIDEYVIIMPTVNPAETQDCFLNNQPAGVGLVLPSAERVFNLPAGLMPMNVRFEDESGPIIQLHGYDLEQSEGRIDLTLYWEALVDGQVDYTRFVHLVDPAGEPNPIVQNDGMPRYNSYPTSQWVAGEVVPDTLSLDLANVPAGDYQIFVGLYRNLGTEFPRLTAVDANGEQIPFNYVPLPSTIIIDGE